MSLVGLAELVLSEPGLAGAVEEARENRVPVLDLTGPAALRPFLVKGLVTERGGLLSHGAIVAREFGIPSVVAVDRATERIPQHATIELDGDRGHVRILD